MIDFLIVSNVILWITVVALSLMMFAMLRQIGVLYERIAPAGALMVSQQLSAGDDAPKLELINQNSGTPVMIGNADKHGKSRLIFFVSPDCPLCKTILPTFKSVAHAEASWLNVSLATDCEVDELQRFISDQALRKYEFFNSRELGSAYAVAKLPFAVLIDGNGRFISSGLVNSREHFESLINAKHNKVASLQDYLECVAAN